MRRAAKLFLRSSLVLVVLAGNSLGTDKHWLPDLEWQTKSNWVGGLLPNAESSVIFPEQTWHTVGLPNSGNLEVAKIYLPKEGSLALGENAVLALSELKKPEKFVRWAKKGLYLWIDPDNWGWYTEATPHVDRLPCKNDYVVLPSKDRALSMVLPNVDVQVAGVKIVGEKFPLQQWEWKQLASQPREFTSSHLTVTYANPSELVECIDCNCRGDSTLAQEVCSYMWRTDKCGPPVCEYPLKVEGHCCAFCGGRLDLSQKASEREVASRVNEALEKYRSVVSWHVRKTWNDNLEILVAENGEYSGIPSQEAVDVLSNALAGYGYEILANEATGAALDDSPLKTILGPLLGIPLILILLLLVAFPYYGYSYSQVLIAWREAFASCGAASSSKRKAKSGRSFSFARFKNDAEGNVDLTESIVAEEAEPVEEDSDMDEPSSSNKQFENPLYRSTRGADKSKTVAEKQMTDVNAAVSLSTLEKRVREDGIEELALE